VAVPKLTRLAADFVMVVHTLTHLAADRVPAGEALRNQLLGLLDVLGRSAHAVGYSAEEIEEARFALVAWADEAIQKLDWPGREAWLREPLQKQLYRTNRAGNELFDHLAKLPAEQLAAREVYLLVLTLGFEGQYQGREAERRTLLAQQYEFLRSSRRVLEAAREGQLSPAAYELEIELPGTLGPGLGIGVGALGIVLGLTGIYGVLWYILRAVSGVIPPAGGL